MGAYPDAHARTHRRTPLDRPPRLRRAPRRGRRGGRDQRAGPRARTRHEPPCGDGHGRGHLHRRAQPEGPHQARAGRDPAPARPARPGREHAQRPHRARADPHPAQPHRHGDRATHPGDHRRPRGDVERRPPPTGHRPGRGRRVGRVRLHRRRRRRPLRGLLREQDQVLPVGPLVAAGHRRADDHREQPEAGPGLQARPRGRHPRLPPPAPVRARRRRPREGLHGSGLPPRRAPGRPPGGERHRRAARRTPATPATPR